MRAAVPATCALGLLAAGLVVLAVPMEAGGSPCGGSTLAVATRSAFVTAHGRACVDEARHEVALSGVLVVIGATSAVLARRAVRLDG